MHIIAIDGPAGAGKSTLARQLARRLGFLYLDTGALYRALTWKALQEGVNLEDETALEKITRTARLDIRPAPEGVRVFVDGTEVTGEIRTPEVTRNTFYLARSPRVRAALLPLQRQFGERNNLVVEGRDTTTVIFPRATLKIYLDASLKTRAGRRTLDLEKIGARQPVPEVEREMAERDRQDLSRRVAPLVRAPDAHYLDTSGLTVDQEVAAVLKLFETVRYQAHPGDS